MLSPSFLAEYEAAELRGEHPLFDSFNGLGYLVYRRTYSRPLYHNGEYHRHEEWWETVARVVDGADAIGADYTPEEAEKLFDLIWNLKALPGGRMLWQLGTENVNRLGSASLVNCYYTELTSASDFRFLFEMLMLGGGVGFNVSKNSVRHLPITEGGTATRKESFDVDLVVPDNREGWGELLERVIDSKLYGGEFTYSTDAIRPEGAPIKTFGGTASGPGILIDGVETIIEIMDGSVGRRLSTVEVLDIANIIGSIVVSGNVRRSAQIALGDATDTDFLQAKRWDGTTPSYRAMSNNTVFTHDPDDLPEAFWQGYDGKGEAYGLFNVDYSQDYGRLGEKNPDWSIDGVNPCGEIPLANRESCNLTELVVPKFDSEAELAEAARLLYKMQKAIAALPHIDPETSHITSQNMRLGMGVTGIAQATKAQLGWLSPVYEMLKEYDWWWSSEKHLQHSIRLTTVKPSGTLSLLAGVTPGVHPGYSRHHIRRVRVAANDAVFAWAQEMGVPWEWSEDYDGELDTRTAVLEFPCTFPKGTALAPSQTALKQLERHRLMQKVWADNAVSVTVTFNPDELTDIKEYLRENWSTTKSVSFLPYKDHGYRQAPLEPITKKEYDKRSAALELKHSVARGDTFIDAADCEGGACPIR